MEEGATGEGISIEEIQLEQPGQEAGSPTTKSTDKDASRGASTPSKNEEKSPRKRNRKRKSRDRGSLEKHQDVVDSQSNPELRKDPDTQGTQGGNSDQHDVPAPATQGVEPETAEKPSDSQSSIEDIALAPGPKPSDSQSSIEDVAPASGPSDSATNISLESDDESIDLSHASDMTIEQRNSLYMKAKSFQTKGKSDLALKYFLGCLSGLEQDSGFTYMPQCMHNVADLFYAKEEYEKAVQFIQAEKMYYEMALIDVRKYANQKEKDKIQESGEAPPVEVSDTETESLKAQEYEDLARLCLDEKQPQLALEYAGKSTKLRQELLGPDHPLTVESLDFFTAVFAEAGKEQYSESMKKLETMPAESDIPPTEQRDAPPGVETEQNGTTASASGSTSGGALSLSQSSTLRQRKKVTKEEGGAAETSQLSPQQKLEEEKKKIEEEWLSTTLLWGLFIICFTILILLLLMLYCSLYKDAGFCDSARRDFLSFYKKLLHYYHQYVVEKKTEL